MLGGAPLGGSWLGSSGVVSALKRMILAGIRLYPKLVASIRIRTS